MSRGFLAYVAAAAATLATLGPNTARAALSCVPQRLTGNRVQTACANRIPAP